jgi:hypothetical protein
LIQADLNVVNDMVEGGCEIWTADVTVGQGLYVPWGWVVAEKTLNGETHAGIRWMSFLDGATDGLKALTALLLPVDVSKIKAGTAAHFLGKVIGHLEEGVAAKDQLVKLKEEVHSRKRSALQAANDEVKAKRAKMIKKELCEQASGSVSSAAVTVGSG